MAVSVYMCKFIIITKGKFGHVRHVWQNRAPQKERHTHTTAQHVLACNSLFAAFISSLAPARHSLTWAGSVHTIAKSEIYNVIYICVYVCVGVCLSGSVQTWAIGASSPYPILPPPLSSCTFLSFPPYLTLPYLRGGCHPLRQHPALRPPGGPVAHRRKAKG